MTTENQKVPKVFILGVQRSGKTVFLSVLGMKYMLLEEGGTAAPLGFRLEPQSDETRKLVNRKYSELCNNREWLANTREDEMTQLHWTVYTGARPIFDLATMDCSGEQIRKAFAVDFGGESASYSGAGAAADDALLSASGSVSSSGEFRVEEIRQAVKEATLVCLFINAAAYPDGSTGKALRKNFEDSVDTFWRLLRKDAELARKSLLVLTQTHLVRETIENTGGPTLYLCERGAQSLMQQVQNHKVPIICVSAVNELNSENAVPPSIESDGLFGFLLTVGGIVAGKGDALYELKNRYLEYLRLRNEFARQLAIRSVLTERLQVLREFIAAADSFRVGCLAYVGNPGNLNQSRTQILYRNATIADDDVKAAHDKWRGRLKVDEVWMRQILKVIKTGTTSRIRDDNTLIQLADNVAQEAETTFAPVLYGFNVDTGEGIDYMEWVRQSVSAACDELAAEKVHRRQRFFTFLKRAAAILLLAGMVYGAYCGAARYCERENQRLAGEIEQLLQYPETQRANDWEEVRKRVKGLWNFPMLHITPENSIRNDLWARLCDSGLQVDRMRRAMKEADGYCVAFTNAIKTIQSELLADYRAVFAVYTNFSQYAKYPDFKRLNAPDYRFPMQEAEIAAGERRIGEADDRLKQAIAEVARKARLRQLMEVAETALESLDAAAFDGAANQAEKLVATPEESRVLASLRKNLKDRLDAKRREEEARAEQERKRIEQEWKERLDVCENLLKQAQKKAEATGQTLRADRKVRAVQECLQNLSQTAKTLPSAKGASSANAQRIREIQSGMESVRSQLPYIVEIVAYGIRSGAKMYENIGLPLSSTGNDRCVEIDPETKCASVYLVIPEKDVGSDKNKILAIRRENGKTVRSYYSLHGLVRGINKQERIIERE